MAEIDSIENSIRIDNDTQRGSVLDVIRMVLNCDSSTANTALRRLMVDNPMIEVDRIRLNGKGNITPVADAKTLIQIIWFLPGQRAHHFCHTASEKVCRYLGGDLSLVAEIEARHARLRASKEGKTMQNFFLGTVSNEEKTTQEFPETYDDMPVGFRFLSPNDRADFAKKMVNSQLEVEKQKNELHLKRKRCDDLMHIYRTMRENLGVKLDDRTLIDVRDSISIISRQGNLTDVASDVNTDFSIPTHELNATERGHETGIVPVSLKLGIKVPKNMSGTIGKKIKKLYLAKYSLNKDWNAFPKRQTWYQGRPILENTHYERDEDIIEQAIRSIVCVPGEYASSCVKK